MFNQVILIGNIGQDPEQKQFQNGGSVVSFSLATSKSWKDKTTGERKEKTQWHKIVIFNEAIGKIAMQWLRKGSKCQIVGEVETRKYTDSSGAERYTTEIVLPMYGGGLTLLGGKDTRNENQNQESDGVASAQALDDEIPF